MNLNPLEWDDEQVANYVARSGSFDDGAADADYVVNLLRSISKNEAFIERRIFGFAIIHSVLEVAVNLRPKVKVLSHYHVEVIEIFPGAARDASKKFFNELTEKYGKVADLHGDCVGRARAKLFKRYGCEVVENKSEPNVYKVIFRKKNELALGTESKRKSD